MTAPSAAAIAAAVKLRLKPVRSLLPSRLSYSAPSEYSRLPERYLPATRGELIDAGVEHIDLTCDPPYEPSTRGARPPRASGGIRAMPESHQISCGTI